MKPTIKDNINQWANKEFDKRPNTYVMAVLVLAILVGIVILSVSMSCVDVYLR